MSQSSVVWRILGIVLLILAVAVGGFFVYQAGYANGAAHSAAVAAVGSGGETVQAPAPMPYPYYGYPGPWIHPFFFPFGCFFGFFLIFLFFAGMRMLFFPRWYGRRGWRHHHGYGPWGGPWEGEESQGKPAQPGPTQTA